MRTLGIILIVLGILGFLTEAISFTTEEQVMDLGPLEVERQEERTVPVTPIASGAAVVVGIGLVAVSGRKET